MANDDFSSKNPIFIFCRALGLGHLRGPGVRLGRILGVLSIEPFFLGGGSSQGALSTPPTPSMASPVAPLPPPRPRLRCTTPPDPVVAHSKTRRTRLWYEAGGVYRKWTPHAMCRWPGCVLRPREASYRGGGNSAGGFFRGENSVFQFGAEFSPHFSRGGAGNLPFQPL